MEYNELKEILKTAARDAGLTEYEIYYSFERSLSTETLKDEISAFSSGVGGGICFRCIVDGKMGYASTELLEEDEMRSLVARAVRHAQSQDYDGEVFIFAGSPHYETVTAKEPVMPSAADLKNAALTIQRKMYDLNGAVTDGTQSYALAFENTISISNSHGLELFSHVGVSGCYGEAVVKVGEESQYGFEVREGLDSASFGEVAEEAVEKALSRIGATEIPSGKYAVVFSNDAMRSLLSTFSGIFSAKNVQLGLSLLRGKEGETIASPAVTIVDDPIREGCPIQTSFDSEGVATYRKNVIETGRLNTLLYDLATAKKDGKESTGNGQRSGYRGAIGIAPFNFYLKPGEESKEDLFRKAGDGSLYITELKGLHAGANASTGDFSLESEGFLVENGKEGKPVRSFTVAGNFYTLLSEIDSVANDLKFGLPGSFTLYGAPSVLVKEMSIAGKDA